MNVKDHYAVIVGVNHYTPEEEGGPIPLDAPIKDAIKFEEWLIAAGVPKKNIEHVHSSGPDPLMPTQVQIDKAIGKTYSKVADVAERVYFYFSGHGIGIDIVSKKDNALCLPDWSSDYRRYALSHNSYIDTLRNGTFSQVIFITDCCRTNEYNSDALPCTYTPARTRLIGDVRSFIAQSTQLFDPAWQVQHPDGKVSSVFTDVLIDGLSGAAANETGEINNKSLKDYLEQEVERRAGLKKIKQVPVISGDASNEGPKSIVFNHIDLENETECTIIFNDQRKGAVVLIDEHTNPIDRFDVSQPSATKVLKKGKYTLLDIETMKKYSFDFPLPKDQNNVTFYINDSNTKG